MTFDKDRHLPIILTTLSCLGVGATAVLSRKNTIRAESTPKKSKKEVVRCYIPTMIAGGVTIGLIVVNHKARSNYIAALTAATGLGAETILNNYRKLEQKAREVYGDEKVDEVYRGVAKDTEQDMEDGVIQVFSTEVPVLTDGWLKFDSAEEGDTLFYDPLVGENGTWFRTSREHVRLAWYYCCRQFTLDGWFSIYDFYRALGMMLGSEYMQIGWEWSEMQPPWPDLSFIIGHRDDGEEYYILRYCYDAENLTFEGLGVDDDTPYLGDVMGNEV